MLSDWNQLSDELQLRISHAALRRAADTLAQQAEALAAEIECGAITDRGGADALRLFAAIARLGDGAGSGHA